MRSTDLLTTRDRLPLATAALALATALATACGPDGARADLGLDASADAWTGSADLRGDASRDAQSVDLAPAADLAAVADLAGRTDLDASADLAAPPDLATAPGGKVLPKTGHVYVGAWGDPALGSQPTAIASLEQLLGHKLAIHTSYWGFNGGTQLSTIQSNAAIQDDVANGRIPLISWGCSSAKGTTFADVASGKYDQVIIDAATAVKGLVVPVFIRPAWEFNINIDNPAANPNGNNCYSPANVGNVAAQAAEFIAYFRHLVTLFRQQGANNATWVFCPVGSTAAFAAAPIDSFYPGDTYHYCVTTVGGAVSRRWQRGQRGSHRAARRAKARRRVARESA